MPKFIPGPWELHGYDFTEKLGYHQGFAIYSGDVLIGSTRSECGFASREQMEATARLMKAAPELYRTLKNLLDVFNRHQAGFPPKYELMVLAKEEAENALADADGK